MRFAFDHWAIRLDWVRRMEQPRVWGTPFTAYLLEAMKRLCDSFGEPLRHEANVLTNANAPSAEYPFDANTMVKYLREGDFKFSSSNEVLLVGPTDEMLVEGVNGRAPINGSIIHINFYQYVFWAQNNQWGLFPANGDGINRFVTVIGKLILHELLHCEGFQHPTHPGIAYDPSDIYYRTFPEVAEQAYFCLNRAFFPPGIPTVINLVPSDGIIRACGNRPHSIETSEDLRKRTPKIEP